MFLAGLFGWNEEGVAPAPRSSGELVTETLMLELGTHLKRADKLQRERLQEGRKGKNGSVDYTWLASQPKQVFEMAPGEMLELRDTCARIKTSQCGPVILRFRRLMLEFEPDIHEVPRLFRTVLQDFIAEAHEQDARRLTELAYGRKRAKSLAVFTFKPRLRVNPFHLEDAANSDSEVEPVIQGRARSKSMPEIGTTGAE
ncbi:protein RD3-like [Ambystoma mexicanum]|uniref:protein RD3-like n=1 Tax=Ambystoma mexicanum TaxID=8296 RepID=UPI0037E87BC8